MRGPMRYGIFGGTFDPPHLRHLALAQAAQQQLRLDRVLWVVTADPPHKAGQVLAPVQDRLDMVLAAIQGHPGFEICRTGGGRKSCWQSPAWVCCCGPKPR